jgi:hypothetical protein
MCDEYMMLHNAQQLKSVIIIIKTKTDGQVPIYRILSTSKEHLQIPVQILQRLAATTPAYITPLSRGCVLSNHFLGAFQCGFKPPATS